MLLRNCILTARYIQRSNLQKISSTAFANNSNSVFHYSVRRFTKNGNDYDDKLKKQSESLLDKDNGSKNDVNVVDDGDPFGVRNDDGDNNLGRLPPEYKRDPLTGKFTGEKIVELDDEERHLLNMSEEESLDLLTKRFNSRTDWDEEKEEKLAEQIRKKEAAYNVLGRKVSQKKVEESHSLPLSPSEFSSFQEFMKDEESIDVEEDDIHVQELGSAATSNDRRWRWFNNRKDFTAEQELMEEIMPWHLAPQTKVNRRDAKPIPKELLHHNNLELLRRYTTPGGQILNRVQSRLGARDQRKIAKLIKRARHLGLIPTVGQWKLEDKGPTNIQEEDFFWEKELNEKGLNLSPSPSSYKDVLDS